MKTAIKIVALLLTFGLVVSCSSKPVKTIQNLKDAYEGELTDSIKYSAYAERAKIEGNDNIANMFRAIAKSEAIHAANDKKALEKLGEKVATPKFAAFTVLSTADNLAEAIRNETYEVHIMFPRLLLEAKTANCSEAVEAFTWALESEKKHEAFYKSTLEALNSGKDSDIPKLWYVCSVCGNTYDALTVTAICDFCLVKRDEFIAF